MKDRIGRRVAFEKPAIVIRRSFWSKFISLLGFWPWIVLFVNDFLWSKNILKLLDVSVIKNNAIVTKIVSLIPVQNAAIRAYVFCAAIAIVDFAIFLVIAAIRSRMRVYVYTDTMVYVPTYRPRVNAKARSFVGVYQANILPVNGFFLFAWIRGIRRLFRRYRDIVISCPGSQTDGTIILRGISNYKQVLTQLNAIRVSESTNIAYSMPTEPSTPKIAK